MVKVSIIIPVYKAEKYIADCINSVIAQSQPEGLECIFIDDCGNDSSMDIIEHTIQSYVGQISFKVLRQEYNQGPSAARNRGIREARGEYLFFLDADDTITPVCIGKLYGLAKEYNADYVQGEYSSPASPLPPSQGRGTPKHPSHDIPRFLDDRRAIKTLLLDHNKIQFTPHNRLVRRQMVIEHNLFFNEQIKVREDFLWMTFVAKYVGRFASCDEVTYNRGYNEGSLTHNIDIERETVGYRVLIETMVNNYDPFLLGCQKELALEALMMALRAGYYHDEQEHRHLIEIVKSKNNAVENLLLAIYLKTGNSRVLHLLIRLYKRNDG